jgi:hypothetical protein
MYNYHSDTPYVATIGEYPDKIERTRFLEAYTAHGPGTDEEKESFRHSLEREITDWRVLSHAFWCLWGVVMSEDDPELVLANGENGECTILLEDETLNEDGVLGSADYFDYIAYADQKMRLFWGELASGRMFDDYKDRVDGCLIIKE